MVRPQLLTGLLVCSVMTTTLVSHSLADEHPFDLYKIEKHQLESAIINQTFAISVQLPIRLKDGSERFPVLYITDANTDPRYETDNFLMQWTGDIPRFISVGIGYSTWAEWQLRDRDLTPTDIGPVESYSELIDFGSISFEGERTGGAGNFLRFIREELKPFIDRNYPTIPQDNGYFGDSYGGLFGLYVLFNEPTTFNRYILGSPSAWYDDEVIVTQGEQFVESGKLINARLFMSVGALEEEEGDEFRMVTNMKRLETMLSNVKGLEIESYVFPDESHTSVVSMNYIRGVQWAYKSSGTHFLDDFQKRIEHEKASAPTN